MGDTNKTLYEKFVRKTANVSSKIGGAVVGATITAAVATPTTLIGFAGGCFVSPFAALIGMVFSTDDPNARSGSMVGGFFIGLVAAPFLGAASGAAAVNAPEIYSTTSAAGGKFFKGIGGIAAGVVGTPLLIADFVRKINKAFKSPSEQRNRSEKNNNNNNHSYVRGPWSFDESNTQRNNNSSKNNKNYNNNNNSSSSNNRTESEKQRRQTETDEFVFAALNHDNYNQRKNYNDYDNDSDNDSDNDDYYHNYLSSFADNPSASTKPEKPNVDNQPKPAIKKDLPTANYILGNFADHCIDKKERTNSERLSQILYGDKFNKYNSAENLPYDNELGTEIETFLIAVLTKDWIDYLTLPVEYQKYIKPEKSASEKASENTNEQKNESPDEKAVKQALKQRDELTGGKIEEFALKQATDNIKDLLKKIVDKNKVREIPVTVQNETYDLAYLAKNSRDELKLKDGIYEIQNNARVDATEIIPDYKAQAAERRLEIACLKFMSIKEQQDEKKRLELFKEFVSTNTYTNHDRLRRATGLSDDQVINKLVEISQNKLLDIKEEFYRHRYMVFIPELEKLKEIPSIPCRTKKGELVDAANYKGNEILTPDYALQNAIETMVGYFQNIRFDLNMQSIWIEQEEALKGTSTTPTASTASTAAKNKK